MIPSSQHAVRAVPSRHGLLHTLAGWSGDDKSPQGYRRVAAVENDRNVGASTTTRSVHIGYSSR